MRNEKFQEAVTEDPSTRRPMHPWLAEDGSLTFHLEGSPLFRMDACGNVSTVNEDFAFHHSLERDARGHWWAPGTALQPKLRHGIDENFRDDHLVQVGPDGSVVFAQSILDIVVEHGLENRIYVYDRYQTDPFHLNDIQPVAVDGPFFRVGDVLLSLGHLNMVALFRPETNELVWWTQDRIAHQHDVDVVDEHTIAVFNNNRTTGAKGSRLTDANEVLLFDLNDGSVTSPWVETFRALEIRTVSQGLFEILGDGSMLVEETDQGRLLKLRPDGREQGRTRLALGWEFVNASEAGDNYILNWSRYIDSSLGDAVAQTLNSVTCP